VRVCGCARLGVGGGEYNVDNVDKH